MRDPFLSASPFAVAASKWRLFSGVDPHCEILAVCQSEAEARRFAATVPQRLYANIWVMVPMAGGTEYIRVGGDKKRVHPALKALYRDWRNMVRIIRKHGPPYMDIAYELLKKRHPMVPGFSVEKLALSACKVGRTHEHMLRWHAKRKAEQEAELEAWMAALRRSS